MEHQHSIHWSGCITFPELSDTQIAPHSPFNLTHLFLAHHYTILLSAAYTCSVVISALVTPIVYFNLEIQPEQKSVNETSSVFSKAWKEQDKKIKKPPTATKLWTANRCGFFLLFKTKSCFASILNALFTLFLISTWKRFNSCKLLDDYSLKLFTELMKFKNKPMSRKSWNWKEGCAMNTGS